MKINSLGIKNGDAYESYKEAVISALIGYGKMYELLHKQLYRKGRILYAGDAFNLNGKMVRAIRSWNIKSSSVSKYSRDSYNDLGLNQLFMGQSPNDSYVGNPSDGIYHDDCYIQPKMKTELVARAMNGWEIKNNGSWKAFDTWGNILVIGVEIFTQDSYNYYRVIRPDTTDVYPLLDYIYYDEQEVEHTVTPVVEVVNFTTQYGVIPVTPLPDFGSTHGNIVYEGSDLVSIKTPYVENLTYGSYSSFSRIYEDGFAIIGYSGYTQTYGDNSETIAYGGYGVLPLVYIDSGDLVLNRVDFIDQWDDLFELYVHEDGHWYDGIIKIVVIVVSIIISYISAGVLSGWSASATTMALAVIGGAISGMGMVTGNEMLSIIGIVLTLGVGIAAQGSGVIAKEAMMKGLSERAAKQLVQEAGFSQFVEGFVSSVGFSNLIDIGSSASSLYNTLSMTAPTSQPQPQMQDERMKVYAYDDEEYSDKVMDLVKIKL